MTPPPDRFETEAIPLAGGIAEFEPAIARALRRAHAAGKVEGLRNSVGYIEAYAASLKQFENTPTWWSFQNLRDEFERRAAELEAEAKKGEGK
jgi:hypothetical protein